MNYYRRYVGDYLKKTIRLTMAGHGAYGLMLDYYYAEEKPLPLDMDDVYTIAHAANSEDRKVVEKVLSAYFKRREDGFHNQRADEEIAAAKQARVNGRKGGRPITGMETGTQTGMETGHITEQGGEAGGGSVHPPTTNHQPPSFNLQEPTAKPPKVKSAGRGSRLPAAWEPDAEQVKFCRQERPDLLPAATAARFRDYWIAQPGAKGVKLDWSATWRNWVRNEKRGAIPGQSLADRNRAAGEEAQRRFEEEQRERR